MNVHFLKIFPEHFKPVSDGSKKSEVRLNDRDFKTGDTLCLEEWCPQKKDYTGEEKTFSVTHILHGGFYGIEKGFVVMSIKLIN